MKIKKLKKLSQKLSIFTMILTFSISAPSAMYGNDYTNLVVDRTVGEGVGVEFNVDVNPYFSIEKATGSNMDGIIAINNSTSLTFTTPISFSYNINSNDDVTISISATAPTTTGAVNALFGTASNAMTIVFTKSDSTATSAAVTNASSSSPTASSNANAVALTFTPQTPTATIGSAPTLSVDNNALIYDFGAGSYNVPFKIEGSSKSGTYSTADTSGSYKATLVVSKVDV